MLVSVEENNRRWSERMSEDVSNLFPHLVAGEVVRSYLLNVYGLLGKSDQ